MAPTLTSHSFLLTTTPNSRLCSKNSRLSLVAKGGGSFSPFKFGKSKDDSSLSSDISTKPEGSGSINSNPFGFNFGKLPDVNSLVPVSGRSSSGLSFGNQRKKDPSTVFVAGATGQAGVRIAQTLLREGFKVRAGVPELDAAQELARLAVQYKIISKEESNRLNAVQSTFYDAEAIAKAIGNASKVVITVSLGENGPTSAVTTTDALNVVQAAQLAGVGHIAIICDGNQASASTYNVLDGFKLFFDNLFSPSQLSVPELLQKVIETDVSYTFIRTSLTADFSPESSYNVVVSAEGSTSADDYKVAKYQIASVVAAVFSNTEAAENKVVEISTSPSAASRPVDELFRAIPEDERRKVYAEALAKAEVEEAERTAMEKEREAADAAKKLEAAKTFSAAEDKAGSEAVETEGKPEVAVENLLNRAKEISSGFSWGNLSSQIASAVQKSSDSEEKPKVQLATVRGQAKARSLTSQKAVVKQPTSRFGGSKAKAEPRVKAQPKPKAKETNAKPEVRKVFGGLFQQETIYVDDV